MAVEGGQGGATGLTKFELLKYALKVRQGGSFTEVFNKRSVLAITHQETGEKKL